MRRPGARAVFYSALGVATIATIGAYRALQATRVSDGGRTRPVVVLVRDVPEGAQISADAIKRVAWNVDMIPPGTFTDVDSVVGRITRAPLFVGDPVTHSRVAQAGSTGGLEVKITAGKRAMAVPINDVAGLSGLIQPNSRVDVLVTFRADGSNTPREVAKLFMQNLRVLSVGNRLQRTEGNATTNATSATLEVTPTEAERLALAANQGTIQLVLRPFGDAESVRTDGANSRDVIGQLRASPEVEVPRPPAPRPERKRVSEGEVTHAPPPVIPAPVATPVAPTPRRDDSSIVHVFRGSKVEQTKVGRDSIKGRPKW